MAWRDLQNYTEQATNNLYFAFAAMTNKSLKFDESNGLIGCKSVGDSFKALIT